MTEAARLAQFRERLGAVADLAFLPLAADLQYLTGIPRDLPTFGRIIHPGMWVEGAWITPGGPAPVLLLTRMTAEYGAVGAAAGLDLRVLADDDDPAAVLADVLRGLGLPAAPRIAFGTQSDVETLIHLQSTLPDATFSSASDLLGGLRQIKQPDEIDALRRAGEITETAFTAALAQLRHGMTELDIIAEIDFQLRRHGALGSSFTTSLYNSGPNLPLNFRRTETWRRELLPPLAVLFDFGAVYEGYCYDYGRTVSFGEPNVEFQLIHSLVMRAQASGIEAMQIGATCAAVDAAARNVITESGYGEAFGHRLGHGIGLDVHEPPFLAAGDDTVIAAGMAFTVEPSIMQMNGFSARVEDVVVAGSGGPDKLTTGFQELYVVD